MRRVHHLVDPERRDLTNMFCLSPSLCLQDLSCIDDLSNNSLFSSPADSLSEYADAQDFIHADNLAHVPTLWDINTPAQSQLEVRGPDYTQTDSLLLFMLTIYLFYSYSTPTLTLFYFSHTKQ